MKVVWKCRVAMSCGNAVWKRHGAPDLLLSLLLLLLLLAGCESAAARPVGHRGYGSTQQGLSRCGPSAFMIVLRSCPCLLYRACPVRQQQQQLPLAPVCAVQQKPWLTRYGCIYVKRCQDENEVFHTRKRTTRLRRLTGTWVPGYSVGAISSRPRRQSLLVA